MSDPIGPLFEWSPPVPPPSTPKVPDQAAQLARVLSALEVHIMKFLRARIVSPDKRFHMSELLQYVTARRAEAGQKPCAPDSPRRVMRELEAMGCCEVPLRDRSLSLYEVISVSED